MPNLAFIHPFLFRYARGIERYLVNLTTTLAGLGAETTILTWRWRNPVFWPELAAKVHVTSFPTSPYFASQAIIPFYVNHLTRARYDMIFLHFANYGEAQTFQLLHQLKRAPEFSIVFHYPVSQVPHRYRSFQKSGLVRKARYLVGVSYFAAREAQIMLGREVLTFPQGVQTSTFQPDPSKKAAVRRLLDLPKNSLLLLSVAALEERKGIQWVLNALPEIISAVPDVHYIVVGSGPYASQLHALAKDKHVDRHVHFLAEPLDVIPYYQATDLFLLLSHGEGSPLVVFEAMSCGLPVIVSTHSPFDEIVQDEWGLRVDETQSGQLAKNVIVLLKDQTKRESMAVCGRKEILANHTWNVVAKKYLELL